MLRITLAALHLIALGIGLGAVWARARALRGAPTIESLRRAFAADAWWGIAAGLWISTGLWRFFAETEKSIDYYLQNHIFLMKMGLLGLILVLEIFAMIALIKWRRAAGRGTLTLETIGPRARTIATISIVQTVLVVLMVFAAALMARGYGAGT